MKRDVQAVVLIFLGSALLPRILRRTDGNAVCLVQSKFAAGAQRRVDELCADDPALQTRFTVSIHAPAGGATATI